MTNTNPVQTEKKDKPEKNNRNKRKRPTWAHADKDQASRYGQVSRETAISFAIRRHRATQQVSAAQISTATFNTAPCEIAMIIYVFMY